VEAQTGRWAPDRTKVPPVLVPLLSLGRRTVATEGGGARSGTFSMSLAAVPAGGPELQATHLSADLFEAAAMKAVGKDLLAMKVADQSRKVIHPRRLHSRQEQAHRHAHRRFFKSIFGSTPRAHRVTRRIWTHNEPNFVARDEA
jgi:hypothetical protein